MAEMTDHTCFSLRWHAEPSMDCEACLRWLAGMFPIFTKEEIDLAFIDSVSAGLGFAPAPAWVEPWAAQFTAIRAGLWRHLRLNPERIKQAKVERLQACIIEQEAWVVWLRMYRASTGCGFRKQDPSARDWPRLVLSWRNLLREIDLPTP